MRIEFDPAKNETNIRVRRLSFERVAEFDFETAKFWADTRKAYSETRYAGLGYVAGRLHCLCFTPVAGGIRVISFRKANAREGARHGFPLTRD